MLFKRACLRPCPARKPQCLNAAVRRHDASLTDVPGGSRRFAQFTLGGKPPPALRAVLPGGDSKNFLSGGCKVSKSASFHLNSLKTGCELAPTYSHIVHWTACTYVGSIATGTPNVLTGYTCRLLALMASRPWQPLHIESENKHATESRTSRTVPLDWRS
jgi:hypothetical protein